MAGICAAAPACGGSSTTAAKPDSSFAFSGWRTRSRCVASMRPARPARFAASRKLRSAAPSVSNAATRARAASAKVNVPLPAYSSAMRARDGKEAGRARQHRLHDRRLALGRGLQETAWRRRHRHARQRQRRRSENANRLGRILVQRDMDARQTLRTGKLDQPRAVGGVGLAVEPQQQVRTVIQQIGDGRPLPPQRAQAAQHPAQRRDQPCQRRVAARGTRTDRQRRRTARGAGPPALPTEYAAAPDPPAAAPLAACGRSAPARRRQTRPAAALPPANPSSRRCRAHPPNAAPRIRRRRRNAGRAGRPARRSPR